MKKCIKCDIMKDDSAFYKHSADNRLYSRCKPCFRLHSKNLTEKQKERHLGLSKIWRDKNKTNRGLDRVDNSLGYILTNVVSCCAICNRMKLTLTYCAFIEKCRRISDVNKGLTEKQLNGFGSEAGLALSR